MLVEERIRPVKVEYDPDNQYNNKGAQHTQFFKCLDPDAKKDDLVIVSTQTRHGMTVAKIVAIGVADVIVNFDDPAVQWGWVIGPVPQAQYRSILETEKKIVSQVQEANTNKLKSELKAAMGLEKVSFASFDAALPAPTAPPPYNPAAEPFAPRTADDDIPL